MAETRYEVMAHWDADDSRWTATAPAVPGLHAEADTYEELVEAIAARLGMLVPEAAEGGTVPARIRVSGFTGCGC